MRWNLPNTLTVLRLIAAPGVALAFVIFTRPTADVVALILFVFAALTDFFDGYFARLWRQESRFGAMLDPIADKAMVIITLAVVIGLSGLNPWVLIPAAFILFREVFVSGLREFLGDQSKALKVTKLAKWKTTAQMVAIPVLMVSGYLETHHELEYYAMLPEAYETAMSGGDDPTGIRTLAQSAYVAAIIGIVLLWIASILTVITGWDYFRKALPFLAEPEEKP